MALALITGASAGIGQATALELAKKGFSLCLVARRQDRLEGVQAEILKKYPACKVILGAFDITKPELVAKFINENASQFKDLQVLVNNAGLAKGADKLQDGQLSDWDLMLDTNVKGLLYFTKALLPHFIANGRGHIVNLGSVAGRWVYPGGAVYCASKFAVRAISEGLRLDLMGKNIRVSNIEPGMVNTEFSLVRFQSQEKADQVYAGMKPLTATDIAETISWVVERPAHVNIQEIVIYPTDQAAIRDVWRS
jgi:NADP-dependent 3-hydroxy acid dehydrogenase YdfG